jgi:hypothetical protein
MRSNIYHNLRSGIDFGVQLDFQLSQRLDRDKSVASLQVGLKYGKPYLLIEILIHDVVLLC